MLKTAYDNNGLAKQIRLDSWKKQSQDDRDEKYSLKFHGAFTSRPSSHDLRSICSPIEDQGNLGSCTANMLAGMVEANENKNTQIKLKESQNPVISVGQVAVDSNGVIQYTTTITPSTSKPSPPTFVHISRLFEYYATRIIEGTVNEDSGATIRNTIKAANKYGVADETHWPYDISKFTVNPPQDIWNYAANRKVTSYHAISNGDIETMKVAISQGFLVGFGFLVYSYFLSSNMARGGVLRKPNSTESIVGGHAVCLVGYDDKKGQFLVRNSWGTNWGIGGYFWMDYNYVSTPSLSSDFWVVKSNPIT